MLRACAPPCPPIAAPALLAPPIAAPALLAPPIAAPALLAVLLSLGCSGGADGDAPPKPFWLRVSCKVQQLLEQDEFRVRDRAFDPCADDPFLVGKGARDAGEKLRELMEDEREKAPAPTD